jgi:hypothetical protein
MHYDVYGDIDNAVCQLKVSAVAGYPHPSSAVLQTRRYLL